MPAKWIIVAIIGILVLLFFSSLGLKAWGSISSLLEEWGLGPERTNIEKAILCSYFRCIEGCGSDVLDKYDWEEPDPQDPSKKRHVECREFCKPNESLIGYTCDSSNCRSCYDCDKCIDAGCIWCLGGCVFPSEMPQITPYVGTGCIQQKKDCSIQDKGMGFTDLNRFSICGYEAMVYPVNITLEKSEKITQSHLSNIGAKIGIYQFNNGDNLNKAIRDGNCVLVENNGNVKWGTATGSNCFWFYTEYDELELGPGTYSIFTDKRKVLVGEQIETSIKLAS